MQMKILVESPRAVAYRTTADPTFQEPAGSKHDYDQIVIALDTVQLSLAIDGKPAKTSWARGDAQFIGRGVPHESKNTSGKPADFVDRGDQVVNLVHLSLLDRLGSSLCLPRG